MNKDAATQVMISSPIPSITKNAAAQDSLAEQPFLSVVVPCFNTADFLPDFFDSIGEQGRSAHPLEFVFVVDGDPQHSEILIEEWMASSPHQVTLVVQENRGPGAARNEGLERVNGEWVTFLDSDDHLSGNYFSSILQSIESDPIGVDLHVTRLVRVDPSGRSQHHALDFKWKQSLPDNIVDLEIQHEYIQLSSATAVFRRSLLDEYGIRFDERLRTRFEDAHLIARYLLRMDQPRYRLVPSAVYFYRAHETSLIAQSRESLGIYTDVMDIAFRDLKAQAGAVCPTWLSNTMLYEMFWFFIDNSRQKSSTADLPKDIQERLADLSREFLSWIGKGNIRQYHITAVPFAIRSSWEAVADPKNGSGYVLRREYDPVRRLQRVAVHTALAGERLTVAGPESVSSVAYQKVRTFNFFGSTWAYEHIFWLNVDDPSLTDRIRVQRSAEYEPLSCEGKPLTAYRLSLLNGYTRPERDTPPSDPKAHPRKQRGRQLRWLRGRLRARANRFGFALSYRIYSLLSLRSKFEDAWLLVDREDQANDNAEALYRFLLRERPDVNAWFAVSKGSPDFRRLKGEGFKVVAYRSKAHFNLFKQAKVLVSAQADRNIVQPFPKSVVGPIPTFVFLQHGVIKDSLDKWLNPKSIDMFVTSTEPEFNSVAGDLNPYNYSKKEVVLTGLPRHDRLHALQESLETGGSSRTIVIAPTWREYLLQGSLFDGTRRAVDDFEETEFVIGWSSFLKSQTISDLVSDRNTTVALLLHPNLDPFWPSSLVPDGIKRISFAKDDVQEYLARCDVMVTDFSSLPFEAAYANALTVYYQFDKESFYAGGSARTEGYFTYEKDGFGPVCGDLASLELALAMIWNGTHPRIEEFRSRVQNLFPLRDGRASERVVEAIESRLVPYKANHQEPAQSHEDRSLFQA